MRKVAVVVAHADDEVLGCGGTLYKHSLSGDTIHVLYICGPELVGRTGWPDTLDQERRKALAIIGNGNITFKVLDYPDQMLDTIPLLRITQAIEEELIPYQPDIIYTHSGTDLNEDHKRVYKAVMAAARPCSMDPQRILSFEVLSSTEWSSEAFWPNYFEHIGQFIKQKCMAMKAYKSELRSGPHSRSIRKMQALAEYRGAQIGRDYAEGFVVIRERGEVCH